MSSSILLLTVTAVLLAAKDAAVLKRNPKNASNSTTQNLLFGTVRPGDRVLDDKIIYEEAIPDQVQGKDFTFRGEPNIRISAVQGWEVGESQNATVRLTAGGLDTNHVTLRVETARSRYCLYRIKIWGH